MKKPDFPPFIPLKPEFFKKFGLPFSPGTVYRHRCTGGPLRSYTVKDPSGRILFHLQKYLIDVEKNLSREEDGHGRRRS